jgi:hypothetical protein
MKLRKQMAAALVTAGMAAALVTACGSKSEQATTAAPAQTTAAAETTAAQTTEAQTTAAETTAAETTAIEIAPETAEAQTAAEAVTETYQHPLGFGFTWYPEYFTLEETEDGVRLMSTIDEYNNYVSISYTEEYTQEDLKNGLVLQAGTDDVLVDTSTFGSTGVDSDVILYQSGDDEVLQFNLLPYKNGCLMIESGSHIYDEEMTLVSDLISEIYNSIEL